MSKVSDAANAFADRTHSDVSTMIVFGIRPCERLIVCSVCLLCISMATVLGTAQDQAPCKYCFTYILCHYLCLLCNDEPVTVMSEDGSL